MVAVLNSLIEMDKDGVAWITGANIKVKEVVLDKLAHGSSPEEMALQYPHLSLAQIHAALSYYYEHQMELDAEILRDWNEGPQRLNIGATPMLGATPVSFSGPILEVS